MILVGDIGGTNTTIAGVTVESGHFLVRDKYRIGSSEVRGISDALEAFLERPGNTGFTSCCLSGAGPVVDNVCRMTNVPWIIDGNEVASDLGLRTHVINDFSAICYALPLIDTHPEIETVPFPHTDGSFPEPTGAVRAVVGAGTGLGTGFLIEDRGHYTAHASEGGHSDFAPMDDEMVELQKFLDGRFEIRPGAEQFISGQGIKNVYESFRDSGRLHADSVTTRIDTLSAGEKPGAVAAAAETHDGLAAVMRLFVRMYGHYASNTCLFLLPGAGLYLAGGIAAKNERWFTEDHLFMKTFEENYNKRIRPLLRSTPVILIKDYSVSLYGAAHAAISLE